MRHAGVDLIYNIPQEDPFEMTGIARRRTLVLLGLVVMITMIIAASLPHLELQPGMPLPMLENNQVVAAAPEVAQPLLAISVTSFFGIFFGLILGGSFLYMLVRLLTGANWKSFLSFIRLMAVISLVVGSLIFLILLLPSSGNSTTNELPMPTPVPPPTSPLGSAPPQLVWLVGIGLLVICILALGWILTSASRKPGPVELVGSEAEKAWQALKAGLDLKDVIIKCYRQMSLAMEAERGLGRKEFMTTGEFENVLETAGIPHDPIHQLTRLFEAVRYGNWQPNLADEQTALQCLEAIMLSSRTTHPTK